MAYGKDHVRYGALTRFKFKLMRWIASSFPLNRIRIWALRQSGFSVGEDVYVANGLTLSMFNATTACHLSIGNRVAIAPNVILILASDANWSKLSSIFPPIEGVIDIGDDSWIGAGAILLPNIKIGKMSVVAAGAVVDKDVPPYTVVAGVPAKKIRSLII